MEFILVLHGGLANMAWMYFLALGLWGLYRAIRKQGIDGTYLGAAIIGQSLFAVQSLLGLIMWLNGRLAFLSRPEIHILYGAFAFVFLPFIYLVTLRGDDSNRGQWVIALVSLFMFGVSIRLMVSGS